MNYYQHNIGDYRRDTSHLSLLEHGIYRQLLDWYYLDELPIPKITQTVFRRLSARTQDERDAIEIILKEFFLETENGWTHKRCDVEISAYEAKAEVNRENGKLGGRPKKTQSVISGLANDNPNESENNPNHKPLTINHKPVKNKYTPPIGDDLLKSWMEVRKAKRAGQVTELVFNGLSREAEKAGITAEQAIQICCERGWQSFNAEWVRDRSPPTRPIQANKHDEHMRIATAIRKANGTGDRHERDITDEVNRPLIQQVL